MSQDVRAGGAIQGRRGLGWLPDYPDLRDYTSRAARSVKPLLAKTAVPSSGLKKAPTKVDLREWCSPVEDQGQLGSCTAHAGVGMLEYFERKLHGKHIDASRRFLYKVTRSLGQLEGDTGAFLRTTMGAMALFGVPPEDYWPYSEEEFDEEPPAFCYAFAQNYQAVKYYRLDPAGTEPVGHAARDQVAPGLAAAGDVRLHGLRFDHRGRRRRQDPVPGARATRSRAATR